MLGIKLDKIYKQGLKKAYVIIDRDERMENLSKEQI